MGELISTITCLSIGTQSGQGRKLKYKREERTGCDIKRDQNIQTRLTVFSASKSKKSD